MNCRQHRAVILLTGMQPTEHFDIQALLFQIGISRTDTIACNDDSKTCDLGQVAHHGNMVCVAGDGDQVAEGQRVAIGLGEPDRPGRVEDNRQRWASLSARPSCRRSP